MNESMTTNFLHKPLKARRQRQRDDQFMPVGGQRVFFVK
jgi:hypothetical protein